jgi:hypothetical protein
MMRGPCGGRAIDPEASAAWAIVAFPRTSCSQASYYSGVKNHLTPARPHPLQDEDLPGGHQDPQDRTEALGVTHWSSRLPADQLGISHSTVARVWAEHDVNPWQTEAFRFSSDPELEARVCDVVGLYLEPSAHAIVLCAWTRSRRSRRWSAPSLPAPHPRALPAGDIGAEQRLTGAG